MVNVLDAVIESVKASISVSVFNAEGEALKKYSKVIMVQITAGVGLSVSAEVRYSEVSEEGTEIRFSEAAGVLLMLEKEGAGEEF